MIFIVYLAKLLRSNYQNQADLYISEQNKKVIDVFYLYKFRMSKPYTLFIRGQSFGS